MRYEVMLQGNRTIEISEDQKKELEKYLDNKMGYSIRIANTTIDTKIVKGIFPIKEMNYSLANQHRKDIDGEFYMGLEVSSKWSPEDKARRELDTRMLPGLRLSKQDTTELGQTLYNLFIDFFNKNPGYPYAPSSVWWPVIVPHIKGFSISKFFEYVLRQDGIMCNWINQKKFPEIGSAQNLTFKFIVFKVEVKRMSKMRWNSENFCEIL